MALDTPALSANIQKIYTTSLSPATRSWIPAAQAWLPRLIEVPNSPPVPRNTPPPLDPDEKEVVEPNDLNSSQGLLVMDLDQVRLKEIRSHWFDSGRCWLIVVRCWLIVLMWTICSWSSSNSSGILEAWFRAQAAPTNSPPFLVVGPFKVFIDTLQNVQQGNNNTVSFTGSVADAETYIVFQPKH